MIMLPETFVHEILPCLNNTLGEVARFGNILIVIYIFYHLFGRLDQVAPLVLYGEPNFCLAYEYSSRSKRFLFSNKGLTLLAASTILSYSL